MPGSGAWRKTDYDIYCSTQICLKGKNKIRIIQDFLTLCSFIEFIIIIKTLNNRISVAVNYY